MQLGGGGASSPYRAHARVLCRSAKLRGVAYRRRAGPSVRRSPDAAAAVVIGTRGAGRTSQFFHRTISVMPELRGAISEVRPPVLRPHGELLQVASHL